MIKYARLGTQAARDGVYCGRGEKRANMLTYGIKPHEPGWLGNPFDARVHGLENCIALYARAFVAKVASDARFKAALLQLRARHVAGETLTLVCWCHEEMPCHTQVIQAWLEGLEE